MNELRKAAEAAWDRYTESDMDKDIYPVMSELRDALAAEPEPSSGLREVAMKVVQGLFDQVDDADAFWDNAVGDDIHALDELLAAEPQERPEGKVVWLQAADDGGVEVDIDPPGDAEETWVHGDAADAMDIPRPVEAKRYRVTFERLKE